MTMFFRKYGNGAKLDISAYPLTRANCLQQGSQQGTHRAIWFVGSNQKIPGELAIQEARKVAAVGANKPLPRKGAQLQLDNGNYRFTNPNVFALDFEAYPIDPREDFADCWYVAVTWRQPVFGQDEMPATVNNAPLNRALEVKFEWRDYIEDDPLAYKVTNASQQEVEQTLKVMTNTLGEPLPPEKVQRRRLVARILSNTNRLTDSIKITEKLEDTTNNQDILVAGLPVKKHHGRFLSAEQWFTEFYDAVPHFRLEVLIEIGRDPFYFRRKNEGTKGKVNDINNNVDVSQDGLPLPPPYALDEDGNIVNASLGSTTGDVHFLEFLRLRPADYEAALRINNIRANNDDG